MDGSVLKVGVKMEMRKTIGHDGVLFSSSGVCFFAFGDSLLVGVSFGTALGGEYWLLCKQSLEPRYSRNVISSIPYHEQCLLQDNLFGLLVLLCRSFYLTSSLRCFLQSYAHVTSPPFTSSSHISFLVPLSMYRSLFIPQNLRPCSRTCARPSTRPASSLLHQVVQ